MIHDLLAPRRILATKINQPSDAIEPNAKRLSPQTEGESLEEVSSAPLCPRPQITLVRSCHAFPGRTRITAASGSRAGYRVTRMQNGAKVELLPGHHVPPHNSEAGALTNMDRSSALATSSVEEEAQETSTLETNLR